eukprot:CAMPEP_0117424554 /NCGR_PEP_ID=MMETSP0758-20121206/4946_1 /TAXON_ID=63605 /ORGANISM="Percolomonas cosmopolitus, Strain AE-1 (ATCC 50343)" /LENGTH=850 /DNA_ID=CAMNT_0005208395 /DNA_START=2143 /DNA_END=4692 /DNA_ORIENTATION=-
MNAFQLNDSISETGILISNSNVNMSKSIISNLSSTTKLLLGSNNGGMFLVNGLSSLMINQSRFLNNSGALLLHDHSKLFLYNSTFSNHYSGAIQIFEVFSNSIIITNCLFMKNQFNSGYGGAISVLRFDGKLELKHTKFIENNALSGGAIYISDLPHISVLDCIFEENEAQGSNLSSGGAMHIVNSKFVNIEQSRFFKNKALVEGGSLYFKNTLFSKIWIKFGGVSITDSLFEMNSAQNGGAVVLSTEYIIHVKRTSFIKNSALNEGGALQATGEALASNLDQNEAANLVANNTYSKVLFIKKTAGIIIDNSTFEGNEASIGGSISCFSSQLSISIIRTTFLKNIGHTIGGALSALVRSMRIEYCNFFMNVAFNGGSIYVHKVFDDSDVGFILAYSVLQKTTSHENGAVYLNENILSWIGYNSFLDNQALDKGGVIYSLTKVNEENNVYSNNSAVYGGVIALHLNGALNSNNSIHRHNRAVYGGTFYSSSRQHSIEVSSSIFELNRASFGGSFYIGLLFGNQQSYDILRLLNTTFNDHATVAGGILFFAQNAPHFDYYTDCVFNGSSNGYGQNFASDPFNIQFDQFNKFLVKNDIKKRIELNEWNSSFSIPLYSGEKFNLRFKLFDSFQNEIISYPGLTISARIRTNSSTILFANSLNLPVSKDITFIDMNLVGNEDSDISLFVSNSPFDVPELRIATHFLICPQGFHKNEDESTCVRCPKGSYSIVPNAKECIYDCDNVECQGGSNIEYLNGYWTDISFDGRVRPLKCPNGKCFGGTYRDVEEGGVEYSESFLKHFSSQQSRSTLNDLVVPQNLSEISTIINSQYIGSDCIDNREGILCASCIPGFSEW